MNPGLTQAQATQMFNRLLFPAAWRFFLFRTYQRLTETKIRMVEKGNENGFTSNWAFTAFDYTSMRSDHLYVRITDESPATGQALVSLYRKTGGGAGDLVAQGSAANGATVTLAAQNSSGITGTVDIGTVTASETNDKHKLLVLPDYGHMIRHCLDGSESADSGIDSLYATFETLRGELADALEGAIGSADSAIAEVMEEYIAQKIDPQATAAGRTTSFSTDSTGNITPTTTGIIEEFRKAMADNTTVQTILQRVPTVGSLTAQAGNRGTATLTSSSIYPNLRAGKLVLVCTDDTIGAQKFDVKFLPDDVDGSTLANDQIVAANRLQIGGTWTDPEIGINTLLLDYSWTKTGDGTNVEFAAATAFSATGETSTNTNGGVIYIKLTANGGNWDVAVYSDATGSTEVASATNIATGAVFTATQSNSSGLTVSGQIGSGPAGGVLTTFDINVFKADSDSGNSPDRMEIAITDPTAGGATDGLIQRVFGHIFGWYLNETTSGSETILDGEMTRGVVDQDLVIVG